MPTDTRRITGPESSQSPFDFCPSKIKDEGSNEDMILSKQKRSDGRLAEQLRPIFLRAGVISQARGSAYIEMNHTKAICAVYGPREVQRREDFSLKGQLTCELRFTTFASVKRHPHIMDNEEKDLSVQILEALEPAVCLHKYPKSQINVYVTILQHDGSALAAAILCASAALASASIEMYDVVVASTAAIYKDQPIVDPTAEEEGSILKIQGKESTGILTVALLPSINQISALTSDGSINFETLNKTVQLCIQNCQKVFPVLQETLINHIKAKDKK